MEVFFTENDLRTKSNFPVVAIGLNEEILVLFTSECEGTVLNNNRWHSIGYHTDSWVGVHDEAEWRILDDVTIQFKS
jgi:hypothetical protein